MIGAVPPRLTDGGRRPNRPARADLAPRRHAAVVKRAAAWVSEKCPRLMDVLEPALLAAMLQVVTGYLVDGSFNPFLYFRF